MKRLSVLSFLVMFFISTDTFLVSPLLPALSRQFSFPTAHGGWLVSAYAVGYCIMAIVIGPVSDRLNRRTMLIVGFGLFAVSTATCALATGFWSLLVLRFVTGLCASVGSPQIWAIIPQLAPSDRVGEVMAAPTAGLTTATLFGVPIGSFLSSTSTRLPFIVVGGCAALMIPALLALFPKVPFQRFDTAGEHGHMPHLLTTYRRLFSNPRARSYFPAYLVFQTGNFLIMTFIATWFSRDFHLDQTGIGTAVMIIGVGNTLGSLTGPAIMSRASHGRILETGFVVYVIAYALLALSPSIIVACAVLFVTYMTSGIIFPLFMERLQSLSTTQRGTVSTLTNVTMYAGSTLAGAIGGPLLIGVPGFWGITSVTLIAMIVSWLLWWKSGALHDRRRAPEAAQ